MTLDEMKEAGHRAAKIEQAKEALQQARHRLDYFNRHAKADKAKQYYQQAMSWRQTFVLKKGTSYYDKDISIDLDIPFGVIQQQLVNACEDAKRQLIMLGGTP